MLGFSDARAVGLCPRRPWNGSPKLGRGSARADKTHAVAKTSLPMKFTTPASTANLGPGYGVLGLALDRYLEVTLEPRADGGVVVERLDDPEAAASDPRHDPVLRGLRAGAEVLGLHPARGLTVRVEGDAPRGSGLGTISAGYAAGIGAAVRLSGAEPNVRMLVDTLIQLGGDPAHGPASLIGGLVACVQTSPPRTRPLQHRVISYPLHADWRFVVVMPEIKLGTAETKRVLPPTLPHAVTARSTARVIGILHALETADEELLGACLFDEVHVPYRRRLVPGLEQAMARGREAGAAGATVSGHGPGAIAFTTDSALTEPIAAAMSGAFEAEGVAARSLVLASSATGALPV